MSSWISGILDAITGVFEELGNAVLSFVKNGFVELFCNYTTTEAGVRTITGPSEIAYYCFILMGISLVLGLAYVLVNMVRRSR